MSRPQRGDVYWLDFDPATGAEMKSVHPCIIVQNDTGNRHSDLTIVAAVTSNPRAARLPVGVPIPAGTAGLPRDSVVHCGHLYSIDQSRLRGLIGRMPADYMDQIDLALVQSLGLPHS